MNATILTDRLKSGALEFQHIQIEHGSQSLRIERDLPAEPDELHQFHVVDERRAVDPAVLPGAIQGQDGDILDPIELVQRQSEQVDGVVDEGRVRVQVAVLEGEASALVQLRADNITDDLLHLRLVDVHQPEGGEIGAAVFEVLQVDGVAVQAGEEEVVLLGDHAHLLRLLQNVGNVGLRAVQDDVRRLEDGIPSF